MVVLGLLGAGALAATAVFVGATLAYLLGGTGRLDLSISFELYVARSHLKLTGRTLLALFALVVTGILPGLLFLFVRSPGGRRPRARAPSGAGCCWAGGAWPRPC